jgi:hypothetical protein
MRLPYLTPWERNITSQFGEDGVIAYILSVIGEGTKTAVEFGAADGEWWSNTWVLEHIKNWRRWLFEGSDSCAPGITQAYLTVENINEEFDRAGVPAVIDVLSIDVDGNDLWLWKALNRRARLVVIEYNANIPPPQAVAIQYNPDHRWDETSYFGATLTALNIVACSKGLRLIHTTLTNAFFLNEEEAERADMPRLPPVWTAKTLHNVDCSDRPWVIIE